MRIQVRIALLACAGRDLRRDVALQCTLARDIARQANAGAQRAPVGFAREEVLPDARRRRRVGGGKLHAPAALRTQQHHHAGECVDERFQHIRLRRERRALEEELDVRHRQRSIGLKERDERSRQVGGEAFAEEVALRELERDAIGAHVAMKGPRLLAPVRQRRHHVVLEVLADALQRRLHFDAVLAELFRIANA